MVIDARDPVVGGGQIHVKNLCEKLIRNHNCEIDLFVRALQGEDGKLYTHDESFFDGKLRILRCGRPRPFFDFFERIFSIFSITKRIIQEYRKENDYKIIHSHVYLGTLSGKIASRRLKIPHIVTCHGTQVLDKGEKNLAYYVEKLILTQITYDTEITVGKSIFQYPNVNKNIVLIGNGINMEEFHYSEKKHQVYKILFVGRLDEFKGVDILIQAIASIQNQTNRAFEVHLVGYGYEEEQYKKLVLQLGLEQIIFFRGKITGKALANEYTSSDLFVLPSRSEGFGIVILEAMASKVPVISTKSGGPEDIITDGRNGFLVEKNDSNALAQQILMCINGEVKNLHTIVENAYHTVQNKYSWDIISDLVFKAYQQLGK